MKLTLISALVVAIFSTSPLISVEDQYLPEVNFQYRTKPHANRNIIDQNRDRWALHRKSDIAHPNVDIGTNSFVPTQYGRFGNIRKARD